MAQTGESFAIQTGIYVAIALAIFLFFSLWRRAKFTKRFFAPKRHMRQEGHHKPPRLTDKLGLWVKQVVCTSEAEVIKSAGVDAAMYMKILRMGFELFLMVGFITLAVILPINLTSDQVDVLMAQKAAAEAAGNSQYKYDFSDLDKCTMTNVADRSNKLYAHAFIAWAVSFIIFWQLWKYNHVALRLRIYALLNAPLGAESHTVLVTDVPGVEFGTKVDRLDKTALRFLPAGVKRKIRESSEAALQSAMSTANLTKKRPPVTADVVQSLEGTPSKGALGEASAPPSPTPVPYKQQSSVHGTGQAAKLRDEFATAAARLAGGETVCELVESEFRKVYGNQLAQVHVVYDTSDLDKLVAEYEKLKLALTDLVDDYISKKRRGKTIKPAKTTVLGIKYGEWGKEKYGVKPAKVDALEWYRDRLTELWRLIGEEQDKCKGKLWPAAFVTFRSRRSQVSCADALMCQDLSAWLTQPAPPPREVYWPNLGWRAWERSMRSVGMWSAYVAMMLFFMIPVTLVQGLLTLNSLVSFVNSIPIIGTFLTGILPTLALRIFLILLPTIIRLMNIMQGMVSEAEIDLGVVSRFFAFQVVTVFFGSFIAGSFANQLEQFIKDPASIITVLGTAAPQTSIFFMSYIQLQALLTQPLELLRVVPLVIFWVLSKLASTERAKARLWQNQEMTYGTLVPGDTMALMLGVVFCIINPIITIFAATYFAVTYTVWKYQMLYVYGQPYQTGGQVWTRVFDQAMTGTFIFQLMMIFICAIKKKIAPSIICIPLPFLSIFFWKTVHARFWRPQAALSMMSAAELDAKEEEEPLTAKPSDAEASSHYLSPSFKLSETEHQELLAEAERGLRLLGGEESGADLEEAAVNDAEDTVTESGEIPQDGAAGGEPRVTAEAVQSGEKKLNLE